MSKALEDRVKAAIVELFLGGDASYPLEPDTNLIAGGICDSLGMVQLAAALEVEFPGLQIQDQDITHENLGSVSAIVALVRQSGTCS